MIDNIINYEKNENSLNNRRIYLSVSNSSVYGDYHKLKSKKDNSCCWLSTSTSTKIKIFNQWLN